MKRAKTKAEKRALFARRMAKDTFGCRDFVSNTQTTIGRMELFGYLTSTTKGVFAGVPSRKGKAWRELVTVKPKGGSISSGKMRYAEPEVYPEVPDPNAGSVTGAERKLKPPKRTAKMRKAARAKETPAMRRARIVVNA